MDYQIIADSGCDTTDELTQSWQIDKVPLSISIGDQTLEDDGLLNLAKFRQDMKLHIGKITTAAPSPAQFRDRFKDGIMNFGVAISSKLSGTYESALLGKQMFLERAGAVKADIHIFDSLSCTAGEVLVAHKIVEQIKQGASFQTAVQKVEQFIASMSTFFVLESLHNLLNSGRISAIAGKLISTLKIRPVLGSDGAGAIKFFTYARNTKQKIDRLLGLIAKSGKVTDKLCLVITHCNNLPLATKLSDAAKARFNFKEILVLPTNGLSTVYADDGGVIIAF